jgi:murein DD-endopeptidase MepM/ murein hydrolase activator NlpD
VRGQRLARVGNSGNTTFPHVHMHIQDAPQLGAGQGLLFLMQDVRTEIAGTALNAPAVPVLRGMWLEPVPAR